MLPRLSLRRRARHGDLEVVDWLVAGILLIAIEVQIWASVAPPDRAWSALFHMLGPLTVAVRRRWLLPMVVLVAVTAIPKALVFDGGVNHSTGLAGIAVSLLLFYGAGAFLEGWRSWLTGGLGLGIVWASTFDAPGFHPTIVNAVSNVPITLLGCVLPFAVGRIIRDRAAASRAEREEAERLDAERELRVAVAAAGERARLAREIHDVIAHSVSVMVIQAGGARTVMDREPPRADAALAAVERAGREALAEMRRLLGVLDDTELGALAPQPGLADLDELVSRTTATGLRASVSIEGEPVPIPPGVSLCAYRVIQEALTNTIKHAGAAQARVAVRWRGDALELEVADDGCGAPGPGVPTGGHGLAGMRERTALHGGRVEAGPSPAGGVAVRAWIPLSEGVR